VTDSAPTDATPALPSPGQARDLSRKLVRLLVEYGAFLGRGVAEDVEKITLKVPVAQVDEFGLDAGYRARHAALVRFLYRDYFRVRAIGLSNVPARGRVCLVANHSGVLPYDAAMIGHAVEHEHPEPGRIVRPLLDDVFMTAPWLSRILVRSGMARACQENAERLLTAEKAIVIFPEGLQGVGKPYRERYQLKRFGRGGFVRLCLRTKTPIVPVAVIGGEEIHPVLARTDWLRRRLGLLVPPITPTFPLLGPLGVLPLPAKWTIEFGAPIDVGREFGVRGESDDLGINHAKEKIRARVQLMVYEHLKTRRSIWLG
jgi:1-acyl-sn-glycerol-3-phosphate acyltransferase